MKVSVLSKSETAEVVEKMTSTWPEGTVPKVKNFKIYDIDGERAILVSEGIVAVRVSGRVLPFLDEREMLSRFPSVTVDMGAIKFVCNGAKIMRPGIVSMGAFGKGDIVAVRDQVHDKILAVGIALEESEFAKTMTKGYVVENLHYVSDKIWEAYKEVQPTRS